MLGSPHIPAQEDVESQFGNPPITVFRTDRFYVSVLYWLDGATSIHQHGFSGALRVLLGSSLHARYFFEQKERINTELLVGGVQLGSVELLKTGDVRPIPAGNQFIHALFHLDRPSATLVVRTYHTPGASPQYNYLKPCLARDPFYREATLTRKLQSLSLLYGMKHPDRISMVHDLIAHSDFFTAFHVLQQARHYFSSDMAAVPLREMQDAQASFEEILSAARRAHGSLIDLLPSVFEEQLRQDNIIRRRGQITSPEHRFFLALVLNLPQRAAIVDLVRKRYPDDDPIEKITGWIDELSTTKVWKSEESNVLGLDNFDEDALFIFRGLLEGLSSAEIDARVAASYSGSAAETLRSELPGIISSIKGSVLFRGVFDEVA